MTDRLVTKAELHSTTGAERLRLVYVEYHEGGDFHSLLYETLRSEQWEPRAVITREAFQSGCPYRRWVSELHSFLPSAGTAIIQVAEGDRPSGHHSVHFGYSWRRWDLIENRELALLKQCDSPFDPL